MKTMLPEQMEFEDATGADSLEKGIKAYKKSNYIQASELLYPIAEKGNILAQGILGRMYLRGEGVIQNYQEAAKWHCLAAKQGDKYSQHALGSAFYYGVGVTQDYQEAAKWYRLAAKSCDDKSSQYHLNLLYSTGQFISRKIAASY